MNGFDGVVLKLGRADEHLAFLDAARRAFFSEARGIVGQLDPKTGDYVFRVAGDPPAPTWGIRVGEYAHQLRSALDNLLWALIIARGGTPKEYITQFPIYDEESKWDGSAERLTDGVLAVDLAFIKSTQPFQLRANPDGDRLVPWHPLSMLGHLNNVDKHRTIHPNFAGAAVLSLGPGGVGPRLIASKRAFIGAVGVPGTERLPHIEMTMPFPMSPDRSVTGHEGHTYSGSEDPTEIARVFRIKYSGSDPKMEMQPSPTLDISFSGRERPMTLLDFVDIRTSVQEIVDHFRPVFPA